MPKLEPGYKANFEILRRAAAAGDLALVDCQDRSTLKPVRVICAMQRDRSGITMVPLAKLFDGNPYDELNPPNPDGDYENIERRLCPICGVEIYVTDTVTTNGRLVGSCGDAFTRAQWEAK